MGVESYAAIEFIMSMSFMKSGLAWRLSAGMKPDYSVDGSVKRLAYKTGACGCTGIGVDLVGTKAGVAKLD